LILYLGILNNNYKRYNDDMEKLKNLNVFILIVLVLLGFALLYFLYFRVRNQAEVYVGVSVTRGVNIPVSAIYNWIPNWLDNAIAVGDKEISPLGGLTAVVLEKESYEASFYGKYVYLLLKLNAIRDRSGIYLFKNKPLSAGALIDLRLSKAQISGLVTYVGTERPKYQVEKLKVTLYGKAVDNWIADNLKVGAEITDNKKQIIAKVLDKQIKSAASLATLLQDPSTGRSIVTYDNTQRDLQVTVELLAKKIGGIYFYAEMQKVKAGEILFLPFKEVTLNLPITSVTELR